MSDSSSPVPPRPDVATGDQPVGLEAPNESVPFSESMKETISMSLEHFPSEGQKAPSRAEELFGPATHQGERILSAAKPDQSGDHIGNYKLLEQIGQGGFGVVWAADQETPVRRRVALKIVKLGMDTKEVIARFGQERQALAMMDHPNIAKVFDAGATPTGRPFFVMEMVRGVKITDYCDQAKLSATERLELFITVCHAVQHAHQKGIIHRDLKPSNILVTLHDGVPVPKVIDFGVAKAMQHQRLTDLTIYTQYEQMIGTPLYMSPEQAEVSGLDVDTRSDIYSLGVVLYELLTGRTPFDPQKLMRQGIDDIRRTIREQEPQKPSAALHTMALETRKSVARHRHVDPGKLESLIRGDLDWIVMKALEKDRSRRYDTATELAKDIQRHLSHEPVHARAPTQFYRLRRLVRRNRITFAAIGAVAAALVIGLSIATISLINERKARKSEAEQRILAEHHSQQARKSADSAEASELKAKHLLYATDMHLALEALRSNNLGLARRILDRHRPAKGQPDLRNWEWRYLYQECLSRAQATLTRREGKPVFSASYSPDGTLLLLGYIDGRVELWNVASRTRRKVILPQGDQVARAVFSPGGDTIAITTEPGAVTIVNINTGATRNVYQGEGLIRDVSYSRDGQWLAVLSRSPDRVMIVGAADGVAIMDHPLREGGGAFFNNVRISPDKQRIYVSSGAFKNPVVQCVSVPDRRTVWEHPIGIIDESDPQVGSDTGFSAMDLSPDGRTLVVATGYRDSQIRILDADSGQLRKLRKGHSKYILQVAFSQDGRVLASTSEDQTVRVWDTSNWTKTRAPLRGHHLEVNAVAISKDGRFLATGSKDGEVLLWDTNTPPSAGGRRELPPHISRVVPLGGNRMVLGESVKGGWSLIDLLTLAEEPLPPSELTGDGLYPGFIPKSSEPQLPTMDQASSGLSGGLRNRAVSPDGRLLVLTSDSGEIGFYDAVSRDRIEIVQSNLRSVFGIAFSPDGRRLILASGGDEGIAVWDLALRHELLVLPSNHSLLSDIGFTADGNTILVKSKARGLTGCEFWQAPSMEEIDAAERIAGRWPQSEAFPRPTPAPGLAALKRQLESEYRRTLATPGMNAPEQAARRDDALQGLATLLRQQRRYADAEPVLREYLQALKGRVRQDDPALLQATRNLLGVVLARLQVERATSDPASLAKQSTEADSLVDDILGILARKPDGKLGLLKLAAYQLWIGRQTEFAATLPKLFERAQQDADDLYAAEIAALAWSLDPAGEPAKGEQALSLAQRAAKLAKSDWEKAWSQKTLALVNSRLSRYKEAEQALALADQATGQFEEEQLSFQPSFRASIRFIRSMILFRTGRGEEAGMLFSTEEEVMTPLPGDDRQAFETDSALDQVMVWLAYKEARALLTGKSP